MEIPTISACINKISDTIARLPVKLYRRDDGKISEIQGDKRLDLLNGETGDTLNTVDLWKAVVEDYFLGNGAWIYLNFDGIQLKSIHYVDSRNISIMTNTDPIFKAFDVFVNGKKYYDFQFIRLFRKTRNGYGNIPLQHENQRILAVAYNALKVEEKMNKKGGNKPGFLKAKTKLSKEALESAKASCNALYDVDGNGVSILNDGLDFQAISSTAVEMQINENKKANSIELSKIFGFPHTIIDGGASDEDNKQFISAVTAILNQIETALDMAMLLEKEKQQGYYFAFDTKELTRGSIKERFEAYEIAIRNHILQVDEIRREEDYEALGFNWVTMGLGDVLLNPKTMEIFTPNTNQLASLNPENRAEMELRFNHNHDSRGRFASGGGGGAPAPKNSEKVLTFGEKSDRIKSGVEYLDGMPELENNSIDNCCQTVNPKYGESDEYQTNCQRCVVTYEARRRGFDVVAKPSLGNDDPLKDTYGKDGWANVFENGEKDLIHIDDSSGKKALNDISSKMQEFGDGSRAIAKVSFTDKSAHAFNVEQVNGETKFIDSQISLTDCSVYFDMGIRKGHTLLLRVDDKKFTSLVEKCVEKGEEK